MIRILMVWFGVVMATPALASHYDLASIDLVEPDKVEALARMGIVTTEDLWKATRTTRQVAKLAASLKVPAKVVRDWGEFCDLLRIEGVGPKVVRVLRLAGVQRLSDLSRQDPERLTARIAQVNRESEILGKLPDVATVRHWIEAAQGLLKKPPPKTRGKPNVP